MTACSIAMIDLPAMTTMDILLVISSCLCLVLLSTLIKFFHKVWWNPFRIQSKMRSQGIRGPPYRFIHGNTKEITDMRKIALSSPMELSHQLLFPRILSHIFLWSKLYGMNFLIWDGSQPQLIITEPELIKEIRNDRDGLFPKKEPPEHMRKLLGDGIIHAQGEKWAKLRKLSNHAFHGDCLKGMIPAMIESVEMMLEKWRKSHGGNREIDFFQEFKNLTSEIISKTAFGRSYLEGKHIFDMLTRMVLLVSPKSRVFGIPISRKSMQTAGDDPDTELDKLQQGIRNSIINMIKKREDEAKMGKLSDGYGSDFLGLLLKSHYDVVKERRISLEEMIDECKTFYLAGQETTTSSLTWISLLLSIHTDWQDKARQEVLELFGQQNPSPEGITNLKIVNMIINESLRLYPPTTYATPRKVQGKEVRLGKLILPANMVVAIPILAVHHNPQIWGEDAHLFKPERFANGLAEATNNNTAAFLPFGLGPRMCVGMNFSLTETKIALSMILQRYKFTLSPNYVHSPIPRLTLCPQHGLQVMLEDI